MKKNHQYKTGRRIMNWRVVVLSATVLWCAVAGYHSNDDLTYTREHQEYPLPVFVKEEVKEPTIEDKIRQYFPRNWKTMIAIAHAESKMNNNAIGYNCWYKGDVVYKEKVIGAESKACKKHDRKYSWSIDCFLLQKNYVGLKECPKNVTLEQHLQEVSELSKVQGLQAWSSFNSGAHKKYLYAVN